MFFLALYRGLFAWVQGYVNAIPGISTTHCNHTSADPESDLSWSVHFTGAVKTSLSLADLFLFHMDSRRSSNS